MNKFEKLLDWINAYVWSVWGALIALTLICYAVNRVDNLHRHEQIQAARAVQAAQLACPGQIPVWEDDNTIRCAKAVKGQK